MNELTKFQEILPAATDEQFPVNARDLHKALQVTTRFNDWIERRLEETDAIEGKDFYSSLSKSNGGRPSKEYNLTLQLAKEISMLERTEIGKLVRRYFIECEEKLKSGLQIPQSLPEALRLAADLAEEKQLALTRATKAESEVKELKPLAEQYKHLMNSEGNFSFNVAAKILKTGELRLFALLRDAKYIYYNKDKVNTPYQTKIDAGYFVVKANTFNRGDKIIPYPQIYITPKGLDHISKKFFNPLRS